MAIYRTASNAAIRSGLIVAFFCGCVIWGAQTAAAGTPVKSSVSLDLEVDQDSSVYTVTSIIQLENILAAEVEPYVRKALSKYGSVSINSSSNSLIITDLEPKLTDIVKLVTNIDKTGEKGFVNLETKVIPLAHVQAKDLVDVVARRLTGDGIAQADNNLNVLIVTDVSSKIDYISQIIGELDKPPQQIAITARVVLLRDDDFTDVGIDLNSLLSQVYLPNYSSTRQDAWSSSGSSSGSKNTSLSMSARQPVDQIINLLTGTGRAQLLSETRIVTLNNVRAAVSVTGWDATLGLNVLPRFGTGDLIRIDLVASTGMTAQLSAETTDLNTLRAAESDANPRQISTSFVVRENETFVAGGLEMYQEKRLLRRSPIIGRMPVIGELFTKKVRDVINYKFLIFLTPKVVSPGDDVSLSMDQVFMDPSEDSAEGE